MTNIDFATAERHIADSLIGIAYRTSVLRAIQCRSEAATAAMTTTFAPGSMADIVNTLMEASACEDRSRCLAQWAAFPALLDAWLVLTNDAPNTSDLMDRRIVAAYRAAGLSISDIPLMSIAISALDLAGIPVHTEWLK